MTHRILSIAWDEDKSFLASVARLGPDEASGQAFDVSPWLDPVGMETIESVTTAYITDAGPRMSDLLDQVHPTIILVFHGPTGAHKARFSSALYEIAGWGHLSDSPPTFIFVSAVDCSVSDCYGRPFRNALRTRTVLTVMNNDAANMQQFARAIGEFRNCMASARGSMTGPAVGLGVFLISSETGEVHLSRRIKAPPNQDIGTIGGAILGPQGIEQALRKQVEERFIDKTGSFWLGPLLACTNMLRRNGIDQHYVDLTFLATVSGKPLRIRADGVEPIHDTGRIWFSIAEVAQWSVNGNLYPPVENAYQALRGMLANHIAVCDRTIPLLNIQTLIAPGLAALIESFEEAEITAAISSKGLKLPRLSGFLFDQSVKQ